MMLGLIFKCSFPFPLSSEKPRKFKSCDIVTLKYYQGCFNFEKDLSA